MKLTCLAALTLACAAPAAAQDRADLVHPELWPETHSPVPLDPAIEARVTALMDGMSVEEKVGQVIQPELKSVTPDDVRRYHIGSVENGGGSVPGGNKHASAADWLAMIDGFWSASVDRADGRVAIPMMWASDAVHGHNNVYGATLFPHNIGLGAARDPDLIRRIGAATAAEVRVLGMDWSFAPTLAVVRDDRWGRTYESYSEDPAVVATYARAMVEGLQGTGDRFLDRDHVIATAKHFLGDGGTDGGRDQGDNRSPETQLRDIAGAGYPAAIEGGVQGVMASFSSWQGTKLHAHRGLLTDVLKERLGFDGILFGDWNAHGQIPGCTNGDCPAAFNAGLDMYNVPQDWRELFRASGRTGGRRHHPDGAAGRRGAAHPAGQAARRRVRGRSAVGPAPRGRHRPARLSGASGDRARGGAQVAGAVEERRRRAADPPDRPHPGRRARRGRHRQGKRRLDAQLAGRRQHQRRLSRRDLDLGRAARRGDGRRGARRASAPTGRSPTGPTPPSWCSAKSPMPSSRATRRTWPCTRRTRRAWRSSPRCTPPGCRRSR